jgi:hypothetical protein
MIAPEPRKLYQVGSSKTVQKRTVNCFDSFTSIVFYIEQTARIRNWYMHRVAKGLCAWLLNVKLESLCGGS